MKKKRGKKTNFAGKKNNPDSQLYSKRTLEENISHGSKLIAGKIKGGKAKKVEEVLKTYFYRYGIFNTSMVSEDIIKKFGLITEKEKDTVRNATKQYIRMQMKNDLAKAKMPSWKGRRIINEFYINKQYAYALEEAKKMLGPKEDIIRIYRAFNKQNIQITETKAKEILKKIKAGAIRAEIDGLVMDSEKRKEMKGPIFRAAVSSAMKVIADGGVIERKKYKLPIGTYGAISHSFVYGKNKEAIEKTAEEYSAVNESDYQHLPTSRMRGTKKGYKADIGIEIRRVSEAEKVMQRAKTKIGEYNREKTANDFMIRFVNKQIKNASELKKELELFPIFRANPRALDLEMKKIGLELSKTVRNKEVLKKMGFETK